MSSPSKTGINTQANGFKEDETLLGSVPIRGLEFFAELVWKMFRSRRCGGTGSRVIDHGLQ